MDSILSRPAPPSQEALHQTLEAIGRGERPEHLNGFDFSPEGLAELDLPTEVPWLDPKSRGIVLREWDLRGLEARGANFENAIFEQTRLDGADLWAAHLVQADLGKASLPDAFLEDANLERARLRFADLQRTALDRASLAGADLAGADLREASLVDADLRGAILRDTDLTGADLSRADLRDADLVGACLDGAKLGEARLERLDLLQTSLTGAYLENAYFEYTRFRSEQLGGSLGEERSREFGDAARAYLGLEGNFRQIGDPDASVWAYLRRRRMQKARALASAKRAWKDGRYREAVTFGARWASDLFVEALCNYGESVPRVLAAILVVHLAFTGLYTLNGNVLRDVRGHLEPVRNPFLLAVYSLDSMTTLGSPNGLIPGHISVNLLMGLQALMGITLAGLLGFVVGNRIRR